jgi:putative ABC transport system permease protein
MNSQGACLISIAWKNLLHSRIKFVMTVVGVTFATVLVLVQGGIYLGLVENAATIVSQCQGDLWITPKNLLNIDFAYTISPSSLNRVRGTKGVEWAERLVFSFSVIKLPHGGTDNIQLVGTEPGSALRLPWAMKEGRVEDLWKGSTIIIDESAKHKLGGLARGDFAEITEKRVEVVGISTGARSFTTAPMIFTSYDTAHELIPWLKGRSVFVVGNVAPGADRDAVVEELRATANIDVYTRDEIIQKTQRYWMTETGVGFGFLITIALGLIVALVIVGQVLYAATIDHLRDFGTLKAIGVPGWKLCGIVIEQAVIVSTIGFILGLATAGVLMRAYENTQMTMVLSPTLVAGTMASAVICAMAGSLFSIRKIAGVDPALVFRA